MSKKIKILFTISVLLNVVLIGMAAGHMVKRWNHSPMETAMKEMSPEGRHIVARELQNAFRDGHDDMRKMRQTKKELKKILTAEEFDADAFESAAEKMHEMRSEMGEKRIDVTKGLAKKLSREDRSALAKKFDRGFHGGYSKDKKRHSFLKEFDKPKDGKDLEMPKDGPKLPGDMPPQP